MNPFITGLIAGITLALPAYSQSSQSSSPGTKHNDPEMIRVRKDSSSLPRQQSFKQPGAPEHPVFPGNVSPQTVTDRPNSYTIYALKFGQRKQAVAMSSQAVGDKSGDSTKVFYMYWLLKGNNGKNILVDAGFTADAGVDSSQIAFVSPEKILAEVNVKPEEITDIIITHPQWDHIVCIVIYPGSLVLIHEAYHY